MGDGGDAEHLGRRRRRRPAVWCVRAAGWRPCHDYGAGGRDGSIVRCPAATPRWCATGCMVAAGACAEWLPQETILFDRCAVDRRLDVELADDAWFLGVESLVFGRAAMGEQVRQAWLRDGIRIRRDGRWLLHDAVRLDGEVDAALRRPAIAGGARAMATLVHVAPDAEAASGRRAVRVCRCGRRSGRQCLERHAGGAYPGARCSGAAACGGCRVCCPARVSPVAACLAVLRENAWTPWTA